MLSKYQQIFNKIINLIYTYFSVDFLYCGYYTQSNKSIDKLFIGIANGDEALEKKLKALAFTLILVIIIVAGTAIGVVKGKSIDPVRNFTMGDTTNDSVVLNWTEVDNADGYHIYSFNDESKAYENIANIDKGDCCSYTVENIESGAIYRLKITAYKYFNKKEYESKKAEEITVYSLPSDPVVRGYSPEESVLCAEWDEQKNAAGYEIEYAKGKDFSGCESKSLTENSFKLEKLKPGDVYYLRVRAFINVDGEKAYSNWSKAAEVKIKEKTVEYSNLDPNKPIVALSFDDGPAFTADGYNSTKDILDTLEKYGARATFFMVGSRINDSTAQLLKREVKLGCELGNHTYAHTGYGKNVTVDAIKSGSEAIKKASGKYPTIFRCPGGMITAEIQKECEKEGMPIAYWSVDTEDWKSRDTDKIYNAAMKNVYDGAIILMHDIYPTTADAVKKIVPKLIDEGYQIATVSEMLTVKNGGKPPKAGQQYVDYDTINNHT